MAKTKTSTARRKIIAVIGVGLVASAGFLWSRYGPLHWPSVIVGIVFTAGAILSFVYPPDRELD
jgi:peptidoglycan/LPS O-acetylase OafA/YrhL